MIYGIAAVLGNARIIMTIIRICFTVVLLFGALSVAGAVTGNTSVTKPRTAKQLYGKQCAACHGLDGRAQTSKGKFSHARDLSDAKWQDDVTDERIFNSIMNGRNVRGNMPAFSDRFSDGEVNLLIKFVRDLRK